MEGARDHAIIITDRQGTLTRWSAGAANAFGWTAEEAVGRPAALIFTPEDREARVDALKLTTTLLEGCANDERRHLRRDGARVFMNGSVHPLPCDARKHEQSFVRIAREETQQRRAQERPREGEARLRLERGLHEVVIRQAPVGISIAEAPSGRPLALNDEALELVGHEVGSEDAGRYKLHGAVHPDGRPDAVDDDPTVRAVRRGEAVAAEEMIDRRGGQDGGAATVTRLVVSSAPVRDAAGAIVSALARCRPACIEPPTISTPDSRTVAVRRCGARSTAR